jgi:hypothetical protein
MLERWYSTIELPLTFRQFEQLPQNPAYKCEYFDGHAWLTPRPKSYHALLDLRSFVRPIPAVATEEEVVVRPLVDEDWSRLPKVLSAAFHRVQPFASLADETRLEAAHDCLRQTKERGEGPLVEDACVVAAVRSDSALVGALLTTLLPAGDLSDRDSWRWSDPPPPDAVAHRSGRPHLTWVFVSPWFARHGVGTALLDEAVRALMRLGYSELASTFLLGNESSTLWHWRAGFRCLPYFGSMRVIREQVAREGHVDAPATPPAP